MLDSPSFQSKYVGLMMNVVGRSLVAASYEDVEVKKEVAGFPVGFILQMVVVPNGPKFTAQVQADNTLLLLKNFEGKADLRACFKHIAHAFLVFSFQEGTAQAFANDRLYIDGDVSYAIRFVRCLNRLEVLILPKKISELAIKRYPAISFAQKFSLASRIYGRVTANLLKGA